MDMRAISDEAPSERSKRVSQHTEAIRLFQSLNEEQQQRVIALLMQFSESPPTPPVDPSEEVRQTVV